MEEWEIIAEQKKIDRIFHQTGFVPIDIPDFDPDDVVIMSVNNKPLSRGKTKQLLRQKADTRIRTRHFKYDICHTHNFYVG